MLEALGLCKFVIQQAAYRYLTKPTVRPLTRFSLADHFSSNICPFQIYQPDFKFMYFNMDDSRTVGLSENRPTIILGDEVPTKYIVLHNSLPHEREEVVEFLVSKPFVMVEDLEKKTIQSQITPVWSWHKGIFSGLSPQASTTKYRLLFKAKLPPFGLSTYVIRSTSSIETSL